jgi:hypothetical protein
MSSLRLTVSNKHRAESGASVCVPNQAKDYAERDKEGGEGGMAVFMQSVRVSSMSQKMDEQRMSVTTMQVIGPTHTLSRSSDQDLEHSVFHIQSG